MNDVPILSDLIRKRREARNKALSQATNPLLRVRGSSSRPPVPTGIVYDEVADVSSEAVQLLMETTSHVRNSKRS